MEENKNISFKHSLESYNKKYRNRREKILKYTKKQVEEFDKKYQGKVAKNYLLKGKKWTLIGDTYYEIPKAPTYKWFRNLKTSTQVLTCALLGGGLVAGIAVPTTLALNGNGQHIVIEEKVKVTFEIDQQEGIPTPDPKEVEVVKGNKITEPDVATIGKTLEGWYDGDHKWDFDKDVVTGDTTLKAKFTTDTCTVTFDCNGGAFNTGEGPSETVFPRNSLIDKPQYNPVYAPNGFLGWTKTKDGTDYWDFTKDKISLSTSTLTLYAKWETVNVFTVNFYVDSTVYHTKQVISGEKVIKPADPTKDGYQFKTWFIKDTTTEFDFSKGITANTDLEADFDQTYDSYAITGDHNIDCDTASASLTKFGLKVSTKVVENDLPTVTWETDNDLLTIASDGTPTVDKNKMSSSGGNKVMVTAKDGNTVLDTFDVEVASFEKFNKDLLASEGKAVAINTSVTGDVYIPSRYYTGTSFRNISTIGENAFYGCKNIKVFIPVPTIIIQANAFKDINNLDLVFADTTNTWFFNGVECIPDAEHQLGTILAGLKEGTESSKAPTSKGLNFVEDGENYSVSLDRDYVDPDDPNFHIVDLLIPAYYYVDVEGKGHTRYDAEHSKKVTKVIKDTTKQFTYLKSLTFHSESNIEIIDSSAFHYCSNLEKVYFDETNNNLKIKQIGHSSFGWCKSLKEIVIPESVTEISSEAFNDSGLQSVTISKNVKTIGQYAFQANTSLSSVVFAENGALTTLEKGAFKDCSSLHQIRLPYNLINIQDRAFLFCGLTTAEFVDDTSVWYSNEETKTITMRANKNKNRAENAVNLNGWGPYFKTNSELLDCFTKTKNSDGTYTLSNYTGGSKYTNIDIPSSYIVDGVTYPITCIAGSTFKDNTYIQKVTIPDTVSRIESDTFANCSNLTSVYIPESVNYIGKRAFQYCSSLNNADFGDSKQTFKLDIPIFTITIDFNPNDNKSNASKLITVKYKYLTCALIKS